MSKKPNIFEKTYRRFEIFYEKLRGLDFKTVIPSEDLGFDKNLVVQCSPSGGHYFKKILKDLKISNHDSILDIGCGKGSAIKTMMEFSFNQISGIEISNHLHLIAKKNFKILKSKNIKIININAENYMNYGDFNYFYMYNPFPSSVMQVVIKKIIAQSSKYKNIKILYNNPICSEVILSYGFEILKEYSDQWGNGIKLYSKNI
jgi:SAM-dependent methyltransferase|tara:strand:- start:333 stop:941 length:609 start_codon:yes stop_codon:yes gene_type:complete